MAGAVGYNFSAGTKARGSQINENFDFFRGDYLPITQSGTWANTNGVMDLGSASFHWANMYVDTIPSCTTIFTVNLTATNATIETLTVTSIHMTTLQPEAWPSFHANRTTSQLITDTNANRIRWVNEEFDTNNDFTNDANDTHVAGESRFTPSIAGKYLLQSSVMFQQNDNIGRRLYLYKNGAVYKNSANGGVTSSSLTIQAVTDANGTTDYFEIFIKTFNIGVDNLTAVGTTTGESIWFSGSRIA